MTANELDRRSKPDITDAGVEAFLEYIKPLKGGPLVRIIEARCASCAGHIYPAEGMPLGWLLEARIVEALSAQWHTDDCPGPLLFATEPPEPLAAWREVHR